MFCTYCGTKLEDGSVFCSNCGNKVNDNIESIEIVGLEADHMDTIESVSSSDEHMAASQEVKSYEDQDTYSSELPDALVEDPSQEEDQTMDLEQPLDDNGVEPSESFKETADFTTAESSVDIYVEGAHEPIEHQVVEQSISNQDNSSIELTIDMRACNTCGALLEHDSMFCSNCGSPVSVSAEGVKIASPDGYITPKADPLTSEGISEEEQLGLTKKAMKQKSKSKKGLMITVAILAAFVLGISGFLIYTKVTLGNLLDSVTTFESLVNEKGLEDYEDYASLIKEAKEKASGWIVFGASDLEDRLLVASKDCESLSEELTYLMDKRSDFEDLNQVFIMDEAQESELGEYLEKFDEAIDLAYTYQAYQLLESLESLKSTLITDNQVYIDSLMYDIYNYDNPDFTQEDWDDYKNQIAIAENYIKDHQFVKAKEQIYYCAESRASIEGRIVTEKEAAAVALLYAKPETLNVMISDVMYDDTSYRNEFEQALEAEIGIDVIFDQFEAESYYDAVNTVFAANTMPDVVYLSQDMYKEFQSKGYLADLSPYWQESKLLSASNFYGEEAMERLKIDGKIYGFTPVRGYTCVTYIRQSWLDKLGLSVPSTYEEFNKMLVAFTENNMGVDNSASYGMTAPGFLYNSEPYTSFLQPFYQNAVPEIYQASNGQWIDGFVQQEMVDALYRLQEAYTLGLLDQNMAQRSVADAIGEFGSGKCGVISLWEGEGADYLVYELKKNGIEDDIIVLEPLTEMGGYIGKEPAVFAITKNCENPGGVMKYFFEPMLDGAAVQKLWTYGVEGYHWASVDMSEDALALGIPDNQLAALPYEGAVGVTYNFNLIDPLLALATLDEIDPGINQISNLAAISASIANQYYVASPNVKYNESYWYYFGEIQSAREEAVNKVIQEGVDPITALEEYKYNVQYIMDQVLSEMNQL